MMLGIQNKLNFSSSAGQNVELQTHSYRCNSFPDKYILNSKKQPENSEPVM